MPILVDGHNLIGRLAMISLQDPDDEEELVRLLRSYQARTGKAIVVIFDPGGESVLPRSRRFGGVQVQFAPRGSDADTLIIGRVRQSRDPGSCLVVTSDQDLANTVMRYGARVKSAEDFSTELAGLREIASEDGDAKLSADEVKAWLSLFGAED